MNSEKTNDLTAQEMFCFILEGLLFEMRYGITAPDKLNGPALTGTKETKKRESRHLAVEANDMEMVETCLAKCGQFCH